MKTIAIAGNPNCGKTVLFNALTGSRQKVGNWAGVTVDRKQGELTLLKETAQVVDLPGIYSLSVMDEVSSQDEKIACEYLLSGEVDVVINVIDASNLQRNLYVTAQLLEMGIPVILALNMMDVAGRRGIQIDCQQLSEQTGCPVIPLVANKKRGIAALTQQLQQSFAPPNAVVYPLPEALTSLQTKIQQHLPQPHARWLAGRLLEKDNLAQQMVGEVIVAQYQQQITDEMGLAIADARYQWVETLTKTVVKTQKQRAKTLTERIDSIVLHRFLGIPIFLFVMYMMFLVAINIGSALQDFFDISSTTIFIEGLAHLLHLMHMPAWTIAILANGLGKGINTVITFTPVIGAMFLCLSFLEDSGYMARAAFVVDRLMHAIGLPGKAFVPLIVGFGCNVPTVMAARTLTSERDRIITIMMAPFMSCGARLAIYSVFVAAFFPRGGQNVVFLLYLIGILVAIGTGLLLRFTLLKGKAAPMLIELPTYHMPHVGAITRNAWQRLKMFLRKAGKFIIPICIILGFLNAIGTDGNLLQGEANQQSVLSAVGKTLTPVFKPMGIKQDNWPATVGLLSGLLAKEVVVGSLNTLYAQQANLVTDDPASFNLWAGLRQAVLSIPENLAALSDALGSPLMANAAPHDVTDGVYGVMYRQFDGKKGAFAFLLFVLLYFPCVTTMAVMRREVSKHWATLSMFWTTGLAYGVATLFYQAATFSRYPWQASGWIVGILLSFFSVVVYLRLRKDKPVAGKRVIPIQLVKDVRK